MIDLFIFHPLKNLILIHHKKQQINQYQLDYNYKEQHTN